MNIRKIAVGVDFSPDSTGALDLAVSLSKELGAELLLVHAGPEATIGPPSHLPSVREWERLLSLRASEAKARLEAVLGEVVAQGVVASCEVLDGTPADALSTAAETGGADLLIVGTHGLGAAKHFLLGSVAERVVRLASCNVLVTREGASATSAPRRVLVATDFSEHADIALGVAIDFAGKGGIVDVVHVWSLSPITTPLIGSEAAGGAIGVLADELQLDANERGEKLLSSHRRPGVTMSFEAIQGKAAVAIVEKQKCSELPYDLVVTGSHGRRGIRRFFLGSVAEKVVRNASCSVLVVHRKLESA